MNGPLPIGPVFQRSPSSWNAFGEYTKPGRNPSEDDTKAGFCRSNSILIVYGSSTVMVEPSNSALNGEAVFGSLIRSQVNLTSSAVRSPYPLWNLTPLRRWKVQVFASGETSHFSASSGMIWFPSGGS